MGVMRSTRFQIAVTLLATAIGGTVLARRGLPPSLAFPEAMWTGSDLDAERHLRWGTDPDMVLHQAQWRALHIAAWDGRKELAELLIDCGADVNARDEDGGTPLMATTYDPAPPGSLDVARLLLARGADPDIPLYWGDSVLCRAVHCLRLGHLRTDEWNAAHVALVRLLMDSGADLDAVNSEGQTALMVAFRLPEPDELAREVITRGADVNARGKGVRSALAEALWMEMPEMAKLLLAGGADPNAADAEGETPLHIAARHGQTDIVRRLIDAGADLDAMDKVKWTPLRRAVWMNRGEVVRLLIDKGADVDILSASALGLAERVSRLLETDPGAVEVRDGYGRTALFYAAMRGQIETAKLLIARGASVGDATSDGQTPLDFARSHREMIELLREHGAKE